MKKTLGAPFTQEDRTCLRLDGSITAGHPQTGNQWPYAVTTASGTGEVWPSKGARFSPSSV
jgi:hypothetical protein